MLRHLVRASAAALLPVLAAGCIDQKTAQVAVEAIQGGDHVKPDVVPVMLNRELPFRYPSELYERRVQGNVTLRLYVDKIGNVHPDSTRVLEPSGYPALDSAAVAGSQQLVFRPAMLKGAPVGVTIRFPVFFRHPQGAPLPGDTILKQGRTGP